MDFDDTLKRIFVSKEPEIIKKEQFKALLYKEYNKFVGWKHNDSMDMSLSFSEMNRIKTGSHFDYANYIYSDLFEYEPVCIFIGGDEGKRCCSFTLFKKDGFYFSIDVSSNENKGVFSASSIKDIVSRYITVMDNDDVNVLNVWYYDPPENKIKNKDLLRFINKYGCLLYTINDFVE